VVLGPCIASSETGQVKIAKQTFVRGKKRKYKGNTRKRETHDREGKKKTRVKKPGQHPGGGKNLHTLHSCPSPQKRLEREKENDRVHIQ
jgi:hypothetical protein